MSRSFNKFLASAAVLATVVGISAVSMPAAHAQMGQQRCYVGVNHSAKSWSIACDQAYGAGSQVLSSQGYTDIKFGPKTWDECAAWAEANLGPKGSVTKP